MPPVSTLARRCAMLTSGRSRRDQRNEETVTASTSTGRDSASLRRHNLRTLLRHLHLHGTTSRAELTRATGLTRSAIADLVGELAERGLAVEGGGRATGRGRPALRVSPSADTAYVLAASIEVETLRVSRVGFGGAILDEAHAPHQTAAGKPENTVEQLTDLLTRCLADEPPLALGVAVPGLVRAADQRVVQAPNLGWSDLALHDRLRRATGLPGPVLIGNEARLAALAEHRRGAGRDCSDLVYVSAEVGVGGGVVSGNRVLTGNDGYGGEIGHMITRPGGRRCRCGRRGCWETEIGADALLRHAGRRAPRDRHAAIDDLLTRADRREDRAVDAFRSLSEPVAVGLANLTSIFNPQRIILGGLLEPMLRNAGDDLRAALDDLGGLPEPLELAPAELGEHGRLLGAAEAAFDRFITELD